MSSRSSEAHVRPIDISLPLHVLRLACPHEGSDVDLLVVMPEVPDKRRAAVEIRRALGDLPVSKDIIVSTPDEISRRGHVVGTVLHAALREGTVLYERA